MITIKDSRNNALSYQSVSLVVKKYSIKNMQIRDIHSVENVKVSQVAIGARDSWTRISPGFLLERKRVFGGKTEENAVIHKNLLSNMVHGVQSCDVMFNYSLSSLYDCLNEVCVDFDQRFVPVEPLNRVLSGQVATQLEFFVPIPDLGRIKTVRIEQKSLTSLDIPFMLRVLRRRRLEPLRTQLVTIRNIDLRLHLVVEFLQFCDFSLHFRTEVHEKLYKIGVDLAVYLRKRVKGSTGRTVQVKS